MIIYWSANSTLRRDHGLQFLVWPPSLDYKIRPWWLDLNCDLQTSISKRHSELRLMWSMCVPHHNFLKPAIFSVTNRKNGQLDSNTCGVLLWWGWPRNKDQFTSRCHDTTLHDLLHATYLRRSCGDLDHFDMWRYQPVTSHGKVSFNRCHRDVKSQNLRRISRKVMMQSVTLISAFSSLTLTFS